jgi:hypothetical protein
VIRRICVVDGQGGGIGGAIIKALRSAYGEKIEVWALGTNAIATSQMMKAGANRGATGESAMIHCLGQTDLILGPISISWANSMLGELTPPMAVAVMSSKAPKILLPLSQERVVLVGTSHEPLPHLVEDLVQQNIKEFMKDV